MLLLQGHLAENNYDGYAPHHHMMLLNLTLPEYEAYYKSTGNIFPNASLKEKILNPWRSALVRELLQAAPGGYDYLSPTDPEHANLYAFPNLHDGIDVMPFSLLPFPALGNYTSSYLNGNGVHSSCALYSIEKVLPEPYTHPVGHCWIRCGNLIIPGVLIEGQSYLSVRIFTNVDRSKPPHWDKTRLTVTLY